MKTAYTCAPDGDAARPSNGSLPIQVMPGGFAAASNTT